MKLLVVEWRDHFSSNVWEERDKPRPPHDFVTVGWLVGEDADYLHLAPTRSTDPDGDVGSTWSILKVAIRKQQELFVAT